MPDFDSSSRPVAENAAWMPKASSPSENPHLSDDFARAYDNAASRIMGPVSLAALNLVGGIGPKTRVLDIAAGAGALSVPAAELGASVMAIDIAPGMVRCLSRKLARFSSCEARVMDGQALDVEDAAFDVAFSIAGISLFPDWRKGLREQARVLRRGGRGCIGTWRQLPGGGPFHVMAQALHFVFPDRSAPPPPEGLVVLSDPERLGHELRDAGFAEVSVCEIETIWEGPAGERYLEDLEDFHPYMGPYRILDASERREVDKAILSIVNAAASNGRVSLRSRALLAVGTRE